MKNNVFLLFTLCMIGMSSCKNATETAIARTKAERKKTGLEDFALLKTDSVFDIKPISEKFSIGFEKTTKKPGPKSYQAAYYSNKEKNIFKKVYFKNENGTVSILEEEDQYFKKAGDLKDAYLVQAYDYATKESTFRIDSLPSEKLVLRNKIRLADALAQAEKKHMEICGTSGTEIRKKDFPKRYSFISEQHYRKLKPLWTK